MFGKWTTSSWTRETHYSLTKKRDPLFKDGVEEKNSQNISTKLNYFTKHIGQWSESRRIFNIFNQTQLFVALTWEREKIDFAKVGLLKFWKNQTRKYYKWFWECGRKLRTVTCASVDTVAAAAAATACSNGNNIESKAWQIRWVKPKIMTAVPWLHY